MSGLASISEIEFSNYDDLTEELIAAACPIVLRGLVNEWPLVTESKKSVACASEYLRRFANNNPVQAFTAPAEVEGRFFYNEQLDGFNFTPKNTTFDAVLTEILGYQQQSTSPSIYLGSTSVNHVLPGLRLENDIDALKNSPLVSIWMGNQSRIAAHYDVPDNLACVVAGKRRFTLFPPDQLENLYIGPLDFTPAGPPASLVDFKQPDLERFPRFAEALKHAQVAELEAGDAIFIPSMWWHHVEGLTDFNILINYWWRQVGEYMGTPADALNHAILSIKDLPESQREAWRNMFDYYVFSPRANQHIPEQRKGSLNPIDEMSARKIRALLINKLNR